MKKSVSMLVAAAFVASTFSVPLAAPAEAASKSYCRAYAEKRADRKVAKRAVRNLVVGGIVGGLFGAAVGGRKTTALAAVGGAATGVVVADSRWQKYYRNAYRDCRYNW
jgi:uncharacterized protein YcfJ